VTRGREHALERPELIPEAQALPAYPRWQQWILKARGVEDFLWAHEHALESAEVRVNTAPDGSGCERPELVRHTGQLDAGLEVDDRTGALRGDR
jgi:hypothetical protein